MIRYDLICDKQHAFEGWFSGSDAYDAQLAAGELACPVCDSQKISKALMAPQIGRKNNSKPAQSAAMAAENQVKMRAVTQAVREYVESNSEHVGERFPEEARKIHYGETEQRNIYGDASLDEVKDLHEEGIAVAPIPWPDREN